MYTSYYNLKAKPFQISSDPAFLWLGEKHKEALATLKYGVLDNKGFMLLTGDVGTGKTTLINSLIQSLSKDILYASVTDPRLELKDFLNYIAREFSIKGEFQTKGKFLLYFKTFLEKAYDQEKKVLLLIDESQLLTQDLLEEIRLLSNIQKDGNNLLNIFFVGQDEFNEILDSPENRAVAQRLTLNYHLAPLTEKETAEYIRHRLYVAGTREQLFDDESVREIHAYSGGFPRRINIICDHCLLHGFVKERKGVDAGMVKVCARDLKIPHYRGRKGMPPPRPIPPEVTPTSRPGGEPAPVKQQKKKEVRVVERERNISQSWSMLAVLCAGMLALFFFLSPATFVAKYKEAGSYLTSMKNLLMDDSGTVSNSNTKPSPDVNESAQEGGRKISPGDREVPEVLPEESRTMKEVGTKDLPELSRQVADVAPSVSIPPKKISQKSESEEPEKVITSVQSIVESGATASGSEVARASADPADAASLPIQPGKQDVTQVPWNSTVEVKAESVEEINPIPKKTVTVRFDPDSSDFYFTDLKHVDTFVDAIKQHPDAVIIISGHTDSYGSENYNYKLSLFRANMLKSFFLGKGIRQEQLEVKGFGSTQPIASNETPEGRQLNRRVEIDVVR